MTDALLAGVEIGAFILAAAVLIAFVLMRPITRPKARCYFDHHVIIGGDQEIGGNPCYGEPEYRYVYLTRGEIGINVPHLDVCEYHIEACREFVDALQNTVKVADDA